MKRIPSKENRDLATDLCLSLLVKPHPDRVKYAETVKKAQKWLITTYGKRGAKKLLEESIRDFTSISITLIQNKTQCNECPSVLFCPVQISKSKSNCKEYSPEKKEHALEWLVRQYGEQKTKEILVEELI